MDHQPQTVMTSERRVGTLLKGKWHIDAILGVGGMATVYSATHRNKKRVAIKMLHPEVSLSAEISSRFLREGYVANTVDHPGTVAVLDDDVTEDGAAFLVMELLEGETLESRQERKGGRLSAGEVLWVAERLLDVLVSAHAKGIVHRDIKPDNLFITTSEQLKVLDFGIARMHDLSTSASATLGTKMGSLLGTPGFMAPEQARGRTELIDARTDLWSVGATLFKLLTDRPVHEAETLNEQLIYAATTPAISLASVGQFSPALVALIDRALAFEKTDRWPSAEAMLAAVRGVIDGEVALPAISSVLPQHRASLPPEGLTPGGTARLQAPPYTPTLTLETKSDPPSSPPAVISSPPSEPRLSPSLASSIPPSASIPPHNTSTAERDDSTEVLPLAPRRRGVFVVLAAVASAATLGLVLFSRPPAATQPASAETSAQPRTSAPLAVSPPASETASAPSIPPVPSASASEGVAETDAPTPSNPAKKTRPKTPPVATAPPTAATAITTATTRPPPPPATTTTAAAAPPATTAKPGANPFDRRF